jgi:hypothetical protein
MSMSSTTQSAIYQICAMSPAPAAPLVPLLAKPVVTEPAHDTEKNNYAFGPPVMLVGL